MVLSVMTKAVLAAIDRRIWDTTAMLAETVGPFVMTNAMLAKTNGHISENGFWMSKSSAC